jgi:hypothetical protein
MIPNSPTVPERLRRYDEEIVAAFGATARPHGRLTPHVCDECDQVDAHLSPWSWESLPDQLIEAHYADLPLLSPEALAYYLAAFLRYAVRHFEPDSLVLEFLIYLLAPSPETSGGWERERLKGLTRGQLDALLTLGSITMQDERFRIAFGDLEPGMRRLEERWNERWEG